MGRTELHRVVDALSDESQGRPRPRWQAARGGCSGGPRSRLGPAAARGSRGREQTHLGPWVTKNVESGAIVHTDAWGGYADLSARGFDHRPIS
jgi:ISXO2-like transposase domain